MKNDLGKDSIVGLVFKLAIPAMFAQFINLLYSIVDRMYIGNIPKIGEIALAGVGICAPIVTFVASFGTLIGLGGSIIMAINMGGNNLKKAKQVLSNSFLALADVSLILTTIFLLLKDRLIMIFGASSVTFPYANTYITICTIGSFFAIMAIGLNYFIICQGFPKIGMFTVIIGAIVNILLDTLFIFGFHMGVSGAAWATVIAQFCSFLFAFLFLIGKKIPIKISYGDYSFPLIKQIIIFGVSPFFILSTDSLIIIVLNSILQRIGGPENGDTLISAATIIQSYLLLITAPLAGLTGGTQPILSYNYGARKVKRVRYATRIILIFALCFTSTMVFLTQFISPYFIKLFTNKEVLVNLASWGINVSILGIILLSFQYSIVDAFTAISKVKISFFLSIFRKTIYMFGTYLIPIILIYFSNSSVTLSSIAKYAFYSQPVSDIVGSLVSASIFYLYFNKFLTKRK